MAVDGTARRRRVRRAASRIQLLRHLLFPYLSRTIVKRSLKLAIPVASAYVVLFAGLAAEFAIVGRTLGGTGIGAVGLAGTFCLVLILSFHALEIAVQAIAARRHGEGDDRAAGAAYDNALLLAFGLGVPLTVLLYFVGPLVFRMSDSTVVAEAAVEYFMWRLPSIPLTIAMLTTIGFLNAISKPVIPAAMFVVILGVNAVLCHGLVGGRLGMPDMGIAGAGLAQTISAVVGCVGFLGVLTHRKFRRHYRVFKFGRHFDREILGKLAKLAWPVFVQQFFANIGMFIFMVIVSDVDDGGISLSASTIARQIGYLTYLPSQGFGIAAATLVGQYLGAKKPREALQSAYVCWALGAILMGFVGVMFILFRDSLVQVFLSHRYFDGEIRTGADDLVRVAEMASMVLVVVGAYQVLESVNTIVGKALQGAGETMFVMYVAVLTQFFVFIPLAWFLAIQMELGAVGAIFALATQLAILAIAMLLKIRQEGWQRREI